MVAQGAAVLSAADSHGAVAQHLSSRAVCWVQRHRASSCPLCEASKTTARLQLVEAAVEVAHNQHPAPHYKLLGQHLVQALGQRVACSPGSSSSEGSR